MGHGPRLLIGTQEMTFPIFAGHRKREIERKRVRERECWESEWEFLSRNRAFTVSYYTERSRKRRRVDGG